MGIAQSTGKNSPMPKGPLAVYEMGLVPGACGLYDFNYLMTKLPTRQKRKFSNSSVTFQNDDRNERFIKIIQHFLIAVREVTVTSLELEKVMIEAEVSFVFFLNVISDSFQIFRLTHFLKYLILIL